VHHCQPSEARAKKEDKSEKKRARMPLLVKMHQLLRVPRVPPILPMCGTGAPSRFCRIAASFPPLQVFFTPRENYRSS
jgi:hypothetical protein